MKEKRYPRLCLSPPVFLLGCSNTSTTDNNVNGANVVQAWSQGPFTDGLTEFSPWLDEENAALVSALQMKTLDFKCRSHLLGDYLTNEVMKLELESSQSRFLTKYSLSRCYTTSQTESWNRHPFRTALYFSILLWIMTRIASLWFSLWFVGLEAKR